MYHLAIPEIESVDNQGKYGRFIIAPMERGFGITLGNALRRTILSALSGAAVNWLKIEGVFHEFSAISHVKESAEDLLLNVRALRLCPLTGEESKLFLEVEGSGPAYAADIQPSADFKIANPEQLLAVLDSDDARLSIEFNVVIGKGYEMASHSENLLLGAIPVDAIFTPVRKVNFKVEPLHRGRISGQERLILEIWTDDTISATEALSRGAQILIDQLTPCSKMAMEPQPEIEEREEVGELVSLPYEIRSMPIEQIGLAQSIVQRLQQNKIRLVGELMAKTDDELLQIDKFGPKSLQAVRERLGGLGFIVLQDTEGMESLSHGEVSPRAGTEKEEYEVQHNGEDISKGFISDEGVL